MIRRKPCNNCGEKLNSKFNFCPSCGTKVGDTKRRDYGMLGKNDSDDLGLGNIFPGIGGGMLNKMIGNMAKMMEKEMQGEMKKAQKNPNGKFRLMINGKEVDIGNMQNKSQPKKQETPLMQKSFSKENIKKFSELQREEPMTKVKRFGDKIIYELEMPELKKLEDVSIKSLENSIEIKAIGKTKSYFKLIPVSMPIIRQELEKGKLILELQEN